MPSSTKWRINISANQGSGIILAVKELIMATAPGGATACTGGTPTASSTQGGNYAPSSAFEAVDSLSYWAAIGTTTAWLQYEFASAVTIVEYRIEGDNYSSYTANPKSWTFEYWDGATWQVVDTQTNVPNWNSSPQWKTFSIASPDAASFPALTVAI